MTAARYTMMATEMKTRKTNGVLLNRQNHEIIGQISLSYVFGRHGLWLSSWSLFVAVIVEPRRPGQ